MTHSVSDNQTPSILLGVTNRVFIDNCLKELEEKLTIEKMNSNQLMQRTIDIHGNKLVQDGRPIAQFVSTDMASFVHNNSPRTINQRTTFALSRLKAFKELWHSDDVEGQKEVFEGIFILMAEHFGEDTALTVKKAFQEIVSFKALQTMINAVYSGHTLLNTIRESKETNILSQEETAQRWAQAVALLIETANSDSYGKTVKEIIYNAAHEWAQHLKQSPQEENKERAEEILNILPVFKKTTLFPDGIGMEIDTTDGTDFI